MTTAIDAATFDAVYIIRGDQVGRNLLSYLRVSHELPGVGSEYSLMLSSYYIARRCPSLDGQIAAMWDVAKALIGGPRGACLTTEQLIHQILEFLSFTTRAEKTLLGRRLIFSFEGEVRENVTYYAQMLGRVGRMQMGGGQAREFPDIDCDYEYWHRKPRDRPAWDGIREVYRHGL